jgi:hypothetical protein
MMSGHLPGWKNDVIKNFKMAVPKLSGHLRLHRDKDAVVAVTTTAFSASHLGLPSSSFLCVFAASVKENLKENSQQ